MGAGVVTVFSHAFRARAAIAARNIEYFMVFSFTKRLRTVGVQRRELINVATNWQPSRRELSPA